MSDHRKTDTPVLGIDLSGPANHSDTCMAWRDQTGLIQYRCGCSDADILQWVEQQGESVMVMIDAPLSYQDGGGYRPCDANLRSFLNARGFHRVGVMAPTMTKMVYLTLRGIALAHKLKAMDADVYETHPGASLLLSGMNMDSVFTLKKDNTATENLVRYWQLQGLRFFQLPKNDHQVMAVQALLTGERWLTAKMCYWQCDGWVV
jgi:predicted nuclease with RNAse H fold